MNDNKNSITDHKPFTFNLSLKFITSLILLISSFYSLYIYTLSSNSCSTTTTVSFNNSNTSSSPTTFNNIVFNIAASADLWHRRNHYIRTWWRPNQMRGFIYLDKPLSNPPTTATSFPHLRISGDTSKLPYTHSLGHRSGLRISRIVSETSRLGLPELRWLVMGDDDTVFVPDNLLRLLSKFDHTQQYYIGSHSESHIGNVDLSYSMAFGGAGFAISKPLADALSKMQDGCIRRYPALYGSDDRIQACMAELGVPLTSHRGFHQFDVAGNVRGLLASHPVAPLMSLHHLDLFEPIFPGSNRSEAVRRLFDGPIRTDSAAVLQQSTCYVSDKQWTVLVSWGFVVEIVRGFVPAREMERPEKTFTGWVRRGDNYAFTFNTRAVARHPCHRPYVFYLSKTKVAVSGSAIVTEYRMYEEKRACKGKIADPGLMVDRVVVYKKPDPGLWDRAPKRNCCRATPMVVGNKTMKITVGICREGEYTHT